MKELFESEKTLDEIVASIWNANVICWHTPCKGNEAISFIYSLYIRDYEKYYLPVPEDPDKFKEFLKPWVDDYDLRFETLEEKEMREGAYNTLIEEEKEEAYWLNKLK